MLRTARRSSYRDAVSLVVLAGCSCAADEAELSPPDLSALVQAYEHPDAELDLAQAQQLLVSAQPMLSAASAARGFDFILGSIDSAKQGLEERGLDDAPAIQGGRATVHSTCPGLAEGDVPDDARDGFIELAVPIEGDALGPVAFGRAEHCRSQQAGRPAELDGPIAIHFGAPLELGSASTPTPIIRIDGVLSVDRLPPISGFDLRFPQPGVTEARIVVPSGGTVVLGVAGTSFSIRERRGTWLCTVQGGMSCVAGF